MPKKELERLQAVNRFLKLNISKEKELQQIVEHAARVCDAPIAMITMMTDELQHVRFKVGVDLEQLTYDHSFCQQAILQDEVFVVGNASTDPYFSTNPFVLGAPHIRFYAGAPLTTSDGDKLGTVCVYGTETKELSDIQRRILKSLSKQVMYLLDFDASLQLLKEEFIASRKTAITLRSFFESSSSCHLLLDTRMNILAFNKALDEVAFTTQGKHPEKGQRFINFVHPNFRSAFTVAFDQALTGNTQHIERHLDYNLGRICWYMIFEPAFDKEGSIIGVSFNAVNITDKIIQEERVREQREALRNIRRVELTELEAPGFAVIGLLGPAIVDPALRNMEECDLLIAAVTELQEKMTYSKT